MGEKRMYNCPCCGNLTYPVPPEDDIGFICGICWWENDPFIQSDDEPSDHNHQLTLNKARENYRKSGISAPQLIIAWAENDIRPWSELVLRMCEMAKCFEIHCWNEETEAISLALRYPQFTRAYTVRAR